MSEQPVEELICKHCGNKWTPRVPEPKFCPMCKRPLREVSSKKQVTTPKQVTQTQSRLVHCSAPNCTTLAMWENLDKEPLCLAHYIDYLHTCRQVTPEEIFA